MGKIWAEDPTTLTGSRATDRSIIVDDQGQLLVSNQQFVETSQARRGATTHAPINGTASVYTYGRSGSGADFEIIPADCTWWAVSVRASTADVEIAVDSDGSGTSGTFVVPQGTMLVCESAIWELTVTEVGGGSLAANQVSAMFQSQGAL